jgi:hypothetical protein
MEDLAVTRKVADAATLLDIRLLDHLIVTHQGFRSLRENWGEYFGEHSYVPGAAAGSAG